MLTKELLQAVQNHELSVEQAMEQLKDLPYHNMEYAKLDYHRQLRTGFPEVIFAQGKTVAQFRDIFNTLYERNQIALATRVTKEQANAILPMIPHTQYHDTARILYAYENKPNHPGLVTICTGGTSDIPVAEEAAVTAELCGANVNRIYDIGVSGIHRLIDALPDIRKSNAVVAVAGMEGALASVLAGQIDKPVIAVPTSIGYGANLQGISALLTMINSCATGMATVNIDNGFGGGYMAAQINRLIVNAAQNQI